MADNTDPSSTPGATPGTGTPVTGNPSGGATPPKTLTHEEALAKIAELEHAHKNATEERDRHRKKLSTYEQKELEAQQAALSDVEKANKARELAEAKNQQYQKQLIAAQVKLAAQAKGIIDPDLAALAIESALEFGEDGMPSNLDKALDDLVKHKPYLLKVTEASTPARSNTPALPAMNPGRSSIQTPSTPMPGKIPGWDSIYKR
jgi:hypothetical protein